MIASLLRRSGIASTLTLSIAFIMVFGVLFTAQSHAQEIKVYTIDSQSIMRQHPAFKEAMKEYQKKIQEMQKELQEVDQEQRQLMQQMMQQQIQQLGSKLQEKALKKMQDDIQEIADEKGYELILDAQVVMLGGTDITDEIVDELDLEEIKPPEPAITIPPQPTEAADEGKSEKNAEGEDAEEVE